MPYRIRVHRYRLQRQQLRLRGRLEETGCHRQGQQWGVRQRCRQCREETCERHIRPCSIFLSLSVTWEETQKNHGTEEHRTSTRDTTISTQG